MLLVSGTRICIVRCDSKLGTIMRLFDLTKDVINNNIPSNKDEFDVSFLCFRGAYGSLLQYYNDSFDSSLKLEDGNHREDFKKIDTRDYFSVENDDRILIFELNSFESSAGETAENLVDPVGFSYISLISKYLSSLKIEHYFFVSGKPSSNHFYNGVTANDYHRARFFLYFQTMSGITKRLFFLCDIRGEEKWRRLFTDNIMNRILDTNYRTADILNNDSFGKVLPLIDINEETYRVFQLPAYRYDRVNRYLSGVRCKELIKNYTTRLEKLLPDEQKQELNECLLNDSVFETLFFVSSLYYLIITYKEEIGNIGIFHEQCVDYVQGIFQLIENSFYHVVDKTNGYANIAFRIRRNEGGNVKYIYEIYMTDLSGKEDSALGIVNTLCENFPELAQCNIQLKDLFEFNTNEYLQHFLENGTNIANHYGLQILNNTVLTYQGSLCVRSGLGDKDFYCSKTYKGIHESIDPWPWHCGTAYKIIIPIDHSGEIIDHQDSIAVRNLVVTPYNDLSKDFVESKFINDKLPVGIYFPSSSKKVDYIDKIVNSLDYSSIDEKALYKIDCKEIRTETQFEILSKFVFLCLTRDGKQINNIALINLNNKYSVIKLFRKFALFYDRQGKRDQLSEKCLFLVDEQATIMLFMKGRITDILQDMNNLQLFGGLDETAISIIKQLGNKANASNSNYMRTKLSEKLRSNCLQIRIGEDNEQVWVKQLNNIVKSDIHKKPFGCRIPDTHVKIGDIHIDTFYEAEVLFSHHYWVSLFVGWLYNKIFKDGKKNESYVMVGYETYIEPVLYSLQQRAIANGFTNVGYGIYENPKYSQNRGYSKSSTYIRYNKAIEEMLNKSANLIFLCGVSTTLSTFRKMMKELESKTKKTMPSEAKNYSLIQVLPKTNKEPLTHEEKPIDFAFPTDNKHEWKVLFKLPGSEEESFVLGIDKHQVISYQKDNTVIAEYLTGVECNWYPADSCKLCGLGAERDYLNEHPIISTNESSVVPSQMIESQHFKNNNDKKTDNVKKTHNEYKINLFSQSEYYRGNKKIKEYTYKDYLYYGHLDRMDHHFIYYVRTAHLIKDILDKKFPAAFSQFDLMCKGVIRKELFPNGESDKNKFVDIIVFPADSGDEVFPTAINHLVFEDEAHMLAVDPTKEFRSNFGTKHSNISYLIEQTHIKEEKSNVKIRFHYVSKHLIAAETFSRIKSLVTSLMCEPENSKKIDQNNYEIFSDVIIFLSRNSNYTKLNYTDDISKYYSFIDIYIPSIRYYGDACPMCKLSQEAQRYKDSSLLKINTDYWESKQEDYLAKDFDVIKNRNEKYDDLLRERYFRRFDYENKLSFLFKKCVNKDDYLSVISSVASPRDAKTDFEALVSMIKVISSPFLYYRENEKKAALSFILDISGQFLNYTGDIFLPYNRHRRKIHFENDMTRYLLLVICLNCLSKMDSTFLLSITRIRQLCDTVDFIFPYALSYEKSKVSYEEKAITIPGFYSCVVENCKRVICGISGKNRARAFEQDIKENLESAKAREILIKEKLESARDDVESLVKLLKEESWIRLLLVLFIDNVSEPPTKMISNDTNDIMTKYSRSLIKEITGEDNPKCFFAYRFNDTVRAFDNCLNVDSELQKELVLESDTSPEGFAFKDGYCSILICSYDNEKDFNKSSVFLIFVFPSDARDIENLVYIRNCLRFRSSLAEIIRTDLSNSSIRSAFQARGAFRLMKTSKLISHSGYEDIFDQSNTAESLINFWASTKEPKQKQKFFENACQIINSFMGRCIAINGTQTYINEYHETPLDNRNGVEKKQIGEDTFRNSFTTINLIDKVDKDLCNFGSNSGETCAKTAMRFLLSYLCDLLNSKSVYWKSFAKKSVAHSINDGFNVVIKIEGSDALSIDENTPPLAAAKFIIKHIIEPISDINLVPLFLNTSSYESHGTGIICLIGILDTLIRNVYYHSNCNQVEVVFSNEGYSFYSFEILNSIDTDSLNSGTGLTQAFFKHLNKLKNETKHCFEVEMNSILGTNQFSSKFTMFRKQRRT